MPARCNWCRSGCIRPTPVFSYVEAAVTGMDDPSDVAQKACAPTLRQPADQTPGLAPIACPVDVAGCARPDLHQVALRPPDRFDRFTRRGNVRAMPAPPAVSASEQEVRA